MPDLNELLERAADLADVGVEVAGGGFADIRVRRVSGKWTAIICSEGMRSGSGRAGTPTEALDLAIVDLESSLAEDHERMLGFIQFHEDKAARLRSVVGERVIT